MCRSSKIFSPSLNSILSNDRKASKYVGWYSSFIYSWTWSFSNSILYFNTESQLYQFRDISATEAFEIFESSPYISEYETLDKAYIAKGKIEQIRKTDKNRFDSENR